MTFYDLLNDFRGLTKNQSEREKGNLFEKFVIKFLTTDEVYKGQFSWVKPYTEVFPGSDLGIDLVAKRFDEQYIAVQCKFYDENATISKKDIDSFISQSSREMTSKSGEKIKFSGRLIVDTAKNINKNALEYFEDASIRISRLDAYTIAQSDIDWDSFKIQNPVNLKTRNKKNLRKHQEEAIKAIQEVFKTKNRAKLIMACGTGKSLTAVRLSDLYANDASGGIIVFFAPSIALVSQTMKEFFEQSKKSFAGFVVCSDSRVGKDTIDDDIRLYELPIPPTTNANNLAKSVKMQLDEHKKVIIFSTYQSIDVIIEAQKLIGRDISLIICDEAHRTAGYTESGLEDSVFVKVHSNSNLQADKRLYMTATPKIYTESSKKKADERDTAVYSMDDESLFGEVAYQLDFKKALEKELLSEYKVLITVVNETQIANALNSLQGVRDKKRSNDAKIFIKTADNQNKTITTEFAAGLIATYKSLIKQDVFVINDENQRVPLDEDLGAMSTAIAFNSSIQSSKDRVNAFSEVIKAYDEDVSENFKLEHVDGTMNQSEKNQKLAWLKQADDDVRILSNARCLTEGIDVPRLDGVIFFDARDSIVDIVQAVGRVMRKFDGKQYGYIILPVSLPQKDELNYDNILSSDRFKMVWKVIKAIRSHDSRLVSEVEILKKIKLLELSVRDDNSSDQTSGEAESENLTDIEPIQKSLFSLKDLAAHLYSIVPSKLGDREYWSSFAKNVGSIVPALEARIYDLIENEPKIKAEFDKFLKTLKKNINSSLVLEDAVSMVVQHIITRPIFDAIFENDEFTGKNVVSKSMQKVYDKLKAYNLEDETTKLKSLYESIKDNASHAQTDKEKQEIIKNLYDNFFNSAFKKDSERLGIVYTPIEVVDYIIHSVSHALKTHFNKSLNDRNVNILDPFTGTGTFIVRLLQSGLIDTNLRRKYKSEIHANEITLLAYYIANLNISAAYHAALNEKSNKNYEMMKGLLFTDTFEMGEAKTDPQNLLIDEYLEENEEEIKNQINSPIDIIIGNPPYSSGQNSANDDNQNITYPNLFKKIQETYAKSSRNIRSKNTLTDTYKLAIRWASDRINKNGIIGFVTNGSFLDGNSDDGLRYCLEREFSYIYVINLRGNARSSGETRRKEGDGIFGFGSRTPVAITILIKDENYKQNKAQIYYHDIGDYLKREEKLAKLTEFKSIANTEFEILEPNQYNDWINQRDESFYKFVEIANKDTKFKDGKDIFKVFSQGVVTGKDIWSYNFSKQNLLKNIELSLKTYESERKLLENDKNHKLLIDLTKISWGGSLEKRIKGNKILNFDIGKVRLCLYRPYNKAQLYYDSGYNHSHYQLEKIFPADSAVRFADGDLASQNLGIQIVGIGASCDFSALIINNIADLEHISKGHIFPLYYYEKKEKAKTATNLFEEFGPKAEPALFEDKFVYERKDAIRDWALAEFRRVYKNDTISKEDIFYYIYGLFHSKDYKSRYADNLSKMLPRIPYCKDFWDFSRAGRELGSIHLNYETENLNQVAKVIKLAERNSGMFATDLSDLEAKDFKVVKMKFAKKGGKADKTTIEFNSKIAVIDIPKATYEYVVNGKSAVEWIMERYQIKTDKDSGIVNDPNLFSDDPRYILNLLLKVIEVSVKSIKIIDNLPKMDFID